MQRFLLYIFSFNVRAGEQRGERRKRTRRKTKRSAYQSVAEISCFVSSILWDKLSLSNAGEWHGTTQESKAVTSEDGHRVFAQALRGDQESERFPGAGNTRLRVMSVFVQRWKKVMRQVLEK